MPTVCRKNPMKKYKKLLRTSLKFYFVSVRLNSKVAMAELIPNTYTPPEWLDKDFLQVGLREGLRRGSLKVTSCSFKPATNIGDNYLSQMFRASAIVKSSKGSENVSVVVKSMPIGESVENFVNESKFFTRETTMLAKTLPQLQAVLNEVGGQKLFAQLYYKQEKPKSSLMMEDLCVDGFKSVNRLEGLDMEHSILVVEYLAIFHAASLVAIERNPSIRETYKYSFWQKHNESNVRKFFSQGLSTIKDCLEVWEKTPLMIEIQRKINKIGDSKMEKLFECMAIKENELNVLNHADPWLSNIMFKYDEGKPIDLRFVDFQLSCYNSPAFDLHYFLFTSPKPEIRVGRLDELLEKYSIKLAETCEKLEFPLNVTLQDLKQNFNDRMFFGFFMTIVLVPFMVAESSDVTDLNDYLESEQSASIPNVAKNWRYRKLMETLLPFFNAQGILD